MKHLFRNIHVYLTWHPDVLAYTAMAILILCIVSNISMIFAL